MRASQGVTKRLICAARRDVPLPPSHRLPAQAQNAAHTDDSGAYLFVSRSDLIFQFCHDPVMLMIMSGDHRGLL